ncbi:C40 family peptidase [Lactobacillus sp. ESL0230]|uniref:C40 family peptidase n=1 Tax=Lactobacillus sp. ESL0230 TaxID=2069353 RepID=UPI000EFCE4D1|nr:C40 family peptidase [Lactobacillus sp. ESL0230]RMC46714.1 peptidoglycan endopeptidase [Lactobacillus sp. ESL0230]
MKTTSKPHFNTIKLTLALISGGVASAAVSTSVANADTITTVKTGDTLKSISKDNHITVKDLAKANDLSVKDDLQANQKITIPDTPKKHTVQAGESVSTIAHKYGLDTEDVLKWNNLSWDKSTIYIGDELYLQDSNDSQAKAKITDDKLIGNTQSEQIVNLAIKYAHMNIPYVWGGSTLAGFDCSGLTQYIYHQVGVQLGRTTIEQESNVTTTDISDASQVSQIARPGDLLFWGSHGASYHVAIYIGNNQYVAAPQPGQNVDIETISNYFMPSFVGHVVC